MSSDEGEISSSPSQGARKRPRDSSPDSDEEEGALLDKPAAPVHPSQQISNSPYNDIAAASPLTVADTPEPDYQGASASDRLNDRVFSGCSNMENYTSDIKVSLLLNPHPCPPTSHECLTTFYQIIYPCLDWRGNFWTGTQGKGQADKPSRRPQTNSHA